MFRSYQLSQLGSSKRSMLMISSVARKRSISFPSTTSKQQLVSFQTQKQPQSLAIKNSRRRRRYLSVPSSTTKTGCNNSSSSSSSTGSGTSVSVGSSHHGFSNRLRKISSTRTTSNSVAEATLQRGQHSKSSSSSISSSASKSLFESVRTFSVATFWSPRTKQAAVTILPVVGNVAYVAIVSGFAMTDMLQLRVLLIGGYSGLVLFHSLHKNPLLIPLRWSAVFVAVNAMGAALLVMDRFAPTLNDVPGFEEDGEALYEKHFSHYFTRGQFHQLLELAKREWVPPGTVLTREYLPSDKVYFIVKGQANLYHGTLNRTPTVIRRRMKSINSNGLDGTDGVNEGEDTEIVMTLTPTATTNIATIEQGGFVNDVAFQRSSHEGDGKGMVGAYGTVITVGEDDADIMVWDVDALRKHLKSKPEMERNIKFCLSDHLVKSLLRQREAAHKRERQGQQLQRRQLLQDQEE